MSGARSIMRPSDLRRAVAEWVALGYFVEITADGKVRISPAEEKDPRDAFDLVDLKK